MACGLWLDAPLRKLTLIAHYEGVRLPGSRSTADAVRAAVLEARKDRRAAAATFHWHREGDSLDRAEERLLQMAGQTSGKGRFEHPWRHFLPHKHITRFTKEEALHELEGLAGIAVAWLHQALNQPLIMAMPPEPWIHLLHWILAEA